MKKILSYCLVITALVFTILSTANAAIPRNIKKYIESSGKARGTYFIVTKVQRFPLSLHTGPDCSCKFDEIDHWILRENTAILGPQNLNAFKRILSFVGVTVTLNEYEWNFGKIDGDPEIKLVKEHVLEVKPAYCKRTKRLH